MLSEVELESGLRWIVERSALEFEQSGRWATFDDLAYEAAESGRPQPSTEVFQLPQFLGGAWGASR